MQRSVESSLCSSKGYDTLSLVESKVKGRIRREYGIIARHDGVLERGIDPL